MTTGTAATRFLSLCPTNSCLAPTAMLIASRLPVPPALLNLEGSRSARLVWLPSWEARTG